LMGALQGNRGCERRRKEERTIGSAKNEPRPDSEKSVGRADLGRSAKGNLRKKRECHTSLLLGKRKRYKNPLTQKGSLQARGRSLRSLGGSRDTIALKNKGLRSYIYYRVYRTNGACLCTDPCKTMFAEIHGRKGWL